MQRYFPDRPLPMKAYLPGCMTPFIDESILKSTFPQPVSNSTWQKNADWLYGIDLFNNEFYWETHAVLEAVWLKIPPTMPERRFVQAVIQVAAARLKQVLGQPRPARFLLQAAKEKCIGLPEIFCGILLSELLEVTGTSRITLQRPH